jgi:hypothetical protein
LVGSCDEVFGDCIFRTVGSSWPWKHRLQTQTSSEHFSVSFVQHQLHATQWSSVLKQTMLATDCEDGSLYDGTPDRASKDETGRTLSTVDKSDPIDNNHPCSPTTFDDEHINLTVDEKRAARALARKEKKKQHDKEKRKRERDRLREEKKRIHEEQSAIKLKARGPMADVFNQLYGNDIVWKNKIGQLAGK